MSLLSYPEHYNSNILARFLRSLFPGSRRIPCGPLEAGGHPTHTVSSICDIFPNPNSSGRASLILPDLYAVFMTLTSSALYDIRITLVLPHLCPHRHCQTHALLSRAFPFPWVIPSTRMASIYRWPESCRCLGNQSPTYCQAATPDRPSGNSESTHSKTELHP